MKQLKNLLIGRKRPTLQAKDRRADNINSLLLILHSSKEFVFDRVKSISVNTHDSQRVCLLHKTRRLSNLRKLGLQFFDTFGLPRQEVN